MARRAQLLELLESRTQAEPLWHRKELAAALGCTIAKVRNDLGAIRSRLAAHRRAIQRRIRLDREGRAQAVMAERAYTE